jgi:hypothetical protein
MADDIPVWSPEDHLDRVYLRGHALRRRRTRLLRATPVAALAVLVLVVAVLSAGGTEPDRQRRLRVAGAPDDTTTSTTTTVSVDGVVGGTGSVSPPTTVAPGKATRPTTTVARSTVPTTAKPTTITTTTVKSGTSGVSGTVMFGPQCPVERADQPCPDKPGPADVELRRGDGQVVGKASAGQNGRFAIAATSGQYTVVATTGSAMGSCQPAEATVTSGRYTDITISCDTGIR